jgi:DNA-binding NarL/FixJ family response regulator
MRIVLVGLAVERDRLRRALAGTAIDVVREAETLAEARRDSDDVDGILIASPPNGREDDAPAYAEVLTPRELEVLQLLAEGMANKAIAGRLGISDQTVKFHVAAICGKLGAANRTDAVRRAFRRGLVTM